MGNRKIEIAVGGGLLAVMAAVLFICFKVADLSSLGTEPTYRIYAVFDNIGGLKVRSPVKIGGVVVGRVNKIMLKETSGSYKPYVAIDIQRQYNQIPSDSALSIKTAGLLGEQYIAIDLGVMPEIADEIDALDAPDSVSGMAVAPSGTYFKEGFVVRNTRPAIVLEDLIGQFLYKSDTASKLNNTKEK